MPSASSAAASLPLSAYASQTSGLPREPYCSILPWCSLDEELAALSGRALNFAPGSIASYSNLALALIFCGT